MINIQQYSVEAYLKATGVEQFENAFKGAADSVNQMDDSSKKADLSIGKMLRTIAGIAATIGVFRVLRDSIGAAFDRIDTMEQFERVMTTMTGSTEKANAVLDDTNDIVKGTSYGLDVAAKAVQGFVTSNMDVDQATDSVAAWGDAVSFYGDGSNETFNSVTTTLAQMVAKGKVQMDTMNRLTEAGIPAMQIYADATGQSVQEVADTMQKGELDANEFITVMNDAFKNGTESFAGIEGAAKEAGASWSGSWANMRAATARGVIAIIEAIDNMLTNNGLPTMRDMIANFGSFVENTLKLAASAIEPLGEVLLTLARAIKPLIPLVIGLTSALVSFQVTLTITSLVSKLSGVLFYLVNPIFTLQYAFLSLNAIIMANPIAWLVGLLVGLGATFVYLYKTNETFRNGILNVWEAIKSAFIAILPVLSSLGAYFTDIASKIAEFTEYIAKRTIASFFEFINLVSIAGKEVGNFITSLKTSTVDVFNSSMDWLADTAQRVGAFFVDLKESMNIREVLTNITGPLVTLIATFLGLTSPVAWAIKAFGLLTTQTSLFGDAIKVFKGEMSIRELVETFASDLTTMVTTTADKTAELIRVGSQKAAEFIRVGADMIAGFIESFSAQLPELVETGVQVVTNLITGAVETIIEIVPIGVQIVTTLIESIVSVIPQIIEVGVVIITTLVEALAKAIPMILEAGITIIITLVEAVVSALPVLVETWVKIVTSLIETIVTLLPLIIEAVTKLILTIVTTIVNMLPQLVNTYMTIITNLIDTIITMLPKVIEVVVKLMLLIVKTLIDNLPAILDAGIQIILALIEGIITLIPALIEAAITILLALVQAFIDNLPVIIEAGIQILMALIEGITQIIPQLLQAGIQIILALVEAIIGVLPELIEAGIQILLALIDGLIEALPQLIQVGIDLILALIDALIEMGPEIMEAGMQILNVLIDGLIEVLPQLVDAGILIISELIKAIIDKGPEILAAGAELVGELVAGILSVPFLLMEAGGQLVMDVISGIGEWFGDLFDTGVEMIDKIINGTDSQAAKLRAAGKNAKDQLNTGAKDEINDLKKTGETGGVLLATGLASQSTDFNLTGQRIGKSGVDGIRAKRQEFRNSGDNLGANVVTGLIGQSGNMQSSGSDIAGRGATGARNQRNNYQGVGTVLGVGMASGISGASGNVSSAARSTATSGSSSARGQRSGFSTAGGFLAGGLAAGIRGGRSGVINAASSIAAAALGAARLALDIRSPSRKAYDIGEYYIEGFVNGVIGMKRKVENTVTNIAGVAMDSFVLDPATPQFDIAGQIASTNAQIQSRVSHELNHQGDYSRQPIEINIYDNKEGVRAYVNEQNAIDATIRRFG